MNLLVVHVAAIGDAAMASTLAERIRREQPGTRVTWVCGAVVEPLVRLFDGVDEIIAIDQNALFRGDAIGRMKVIAGLWSRLGGKRFDRAIVLHPDPRYRILVAPLLGVPKSFLTRARHGDMNPVPGRFLGDEYARLLDDAGHVGPSLAHYPMADLRAKVSRPSAVDGRPRVALVPGGAKNALREDALKRWPVEHYAGVASALLDEGAEVVLVGGAQDAWVRAAFAGLGVTDLIGASSLPQALGELSKCELVISHDTGPMHLARLVRAPLIALFGPTMPSQFIVEDETTTVLWGGAHLACRPCYDGREFAACSANVCLSSISPEVVTATARSILAKRAKVATAAR